MKVRISEEYRGNVNPERKYVITEIKTGKELISNLKKDEIDTAVESFGLIVETAV